MLLLEQLVAECKKKTKNSCSATTLAEAEAALAGVGEMVWGGRQSPICASSSANRVPKTTR